MQSGTGGNGGVDDRSSASSPSSASSGSSSSSSNGDSAWHPRAQATWVPRVIPVKNSAGTVIGDVTANSPGDISLDARDTGIIDGRTIEISVHAMLNSLPTDPKMDIDVAMPDASQFSNAFSIQGMLAGVSLSGFGGGLDVQEGTVTLTLNVPAAAMGDSDPGQAIFLRYDGRMNELLRDVRVTSGADENGMFTYTVTSPRETFACGESSLYALAGTAAMPTPAPAPVSATPAPLPATPTPGSGSHSLAAMLAIISEAISQLV